jgi:hypothetical protein
MCFHNLHQAGALAHGEVHFALEAREHIDLRPVVKMDRSEISIRREDANPAGKASQISSWDFILVVLRHIHRMEPGGVQPMPNENAGSVSSEVGSQLNTVLCRVESARFKVSGDNRARRLDSSARISFVIFRLLRSTFSTLTHLHAHLSAPQRSEACTRG